MKKQNKKGEKRKAKELAETISGFFESSPDYAEEYTTDILMEALQAEMNRIREWASKQKCSCEGRIHDPEDLMGKLLKLTQNPNK